MFSLSLRAIINVLVAAVALVTFSASVMAETTLQRGLREGKLRIGFNSEAPYAFVDNSGRATGFAIENARAILKKIGINDIVAIDMAWDSLIPALQANRVDILATGMAVLPKRCALVLFDQPSIGMGVAMMVKSGNPKGIHSYVDAVKSGAQVGVVQGAEEGNWFKAVGMPEEHLTNFPDPAAMLAALRADRVDAFALAPVSIQAMLKELGSGAGVERALPFTDLVINGELKKFYQGEVFRKEDVDLRDAFNKQLATFLGSPEQVKLFEPFGITSTESPPTPHKTVEQLCAGQ